jgi:hypothetical protein
MAKDLAPRVSPHRGQEQCPILRAGSLIDMENRDRLPVQSRKHELITRFCDPGSSRARNLGG